MPDTREPYEPPRITNTGRVCPWCTEPVLPTDRTDRFVHVTADGNVAVQHWHWECAARQAVGSVGHQLGRCSCFGGTEDDPPEMSRREAAQAALALACRAVDPTHWN